VVVAGTVADEAGKAVADSVIAVAVRASAVADSQHRAVEAILAADSVAVAGFMAALDPTAEAASTVGVVDFTVAADLTAAATVVGTAKRD